MAEFLILTKDHWMDLPSKSNTSLTGYERNQLLIEQDDTLTLAQKIKKKDLLTLKYSTRYQPGDPTGEVHGDGFWTDGKRKGFGASKGLALICITGTAVKDIEPYLRPLEDNTDPEKPVLLKRRQYQVDLSQVTLDAQKRLFVLALADVRFKDKATGLEVS